MTTDEVLELLAVKPAARESCVRLASDDVVLNTEFARVVFYELGASLSDHDVAVLRSVLTDPATANRIRREREADEAAKRPNPALPQEPARARSRLPVNRSPDPVENHPWAPSVQGKAVFRRPDPSWMVRLTGSK